MHLIRTEYNTTRYCLLLAVLRRAALTVRGPLALLISPSDGAVSVCYSVPTDILLWVLLLCAVRTIIARKHVYQLRRCRGVNQWKGCRTCWQTDGVGLNYAVTSISLTSSLPPRLAAGQPMLPSFLRWGVWVCVLRIMPARSPLGPIASGLAAWPGCFCPYLCYSLAHAPQET